MENFKLLVVEDDYKVANILKEGLTESGYEVVVANDGLAGKQKILNDTFSLIILDLILPYIDGIELCKFVREHKPETPILMLTALGTTDDKVKGFDAGADDYLVKPFEFRELLARTNALIKRSQRNTLSNLILKVGDLELNSLSKTVHRAGKKIVLTAKEFALLEFLMQNKDKVVTRNQISEKVWGINFDTGTNIIDVYINYIRKKIEKDNPVRLIHTQVGYGYIIREPEE